MASIPEAIQIAIDHHRAGRLRDAEQIYRQVLQANPRDAGATHLMGLVAFQAGQFELAVQWISQAIRLDGSQAVFHANLGEVYRGLRKLPEAQACYEQALRIQPDAPEACNNLATILQAQGQTAAAIAYYEQAVAVKPDYADALNNLGTAWQDQGDWQRAAQHYRRSVEADPAYAKGYYNLGLAMQAQGNFAEARAAFEESIELEPKEAESRYNLAILLQRDSQFVRAEDQYRRALEIRPAFAAAASSLGSLYQARGNLAGAVECYQQALRIDPSFAEAHYNWGTVLKAQGQNVEALGKYRQAIALKPAFVDAHYNLGIVLRELGRLEEAVQAYHETVRLRPDFAMAYNNLGNIYKFQGNASEAMACYQRALGVEPENGEVFTNLGTLLQQEGQLGQTVECYRKAIRCKPDCAEAYNNLGNVLQEQGRLAEAMACYETSLQLQPNAEAHYNRGLLLLSQQRFNEGWPEFDWRLKCKNYPVREFSQPLWDGTPFPNRTLLVHAEQGFGDTLNFARYLPQVRNLGGRVFFEVQPPLVPLLKCSGVQDVIATGIPRPPFDLHVPLLNLPSLFQMTRENVPAEVPYIVADPQLMEQWGKKFSTIDGFKIGLNWQGNRGYSFDRSRSIPLANFAPLSTVKGVRLFSLQKKDGLEQLTEVADRWPVCDLGPELDEKFGAFMDTAAVMHHLDLVITSDTATAHLAGALGVRVWVALAMVPEWRWLLEGDHSPWYPTMRLFRQTSPGDWQSVFERMAAQLEMELSSQ